MNILRLENVVKNYGGFTAVDQVSFEIPEGVVFGMLGPNGAGKTSLIRIITTITRADSGNIWFKDEPLNSRHPELIGYMPEERGLYKKMKVGEHLTYLARLKGLSASAAREELRYWMGHFDIKSWWDRKIEELSKGMQQKVQFIATVVHKPRLLILDEPFSGLDPINANLIKDEIIKLHKNGTTIIFSTHRMEQVEEMCQYIVLINKGQNILCGKVADIRQQFKESLYKIEFEGRLPAELSSSGIHPPTFNIQSLYEHSLVLKAETGYGANDLLRYLLEKNVSIRAFHEILPTMNDIFIRQVTDAATQSEAKQS